MSKADPIKLAVLVSGNGSNLQAIIDNIESGALNAEIKIVISNIEDAFALQRAKKHQIEHFTLPSKGCKSRDLYDKQLVEEINKYNVDYIILAGFMRILSETMITAFPNRIINIHPAILPSFPGLHAQKQAIDYGVKFSGCTVHFVDTGTDTGPIIMQAVVPVEDNDDEASLSAKIQKEEHRIYPTVIQLLAKGAVKVSGRRVTILS